MKPSRLRPLRPRSAPYHFCGLAGLALFTSLTGVATAIPPHPVPPPFPKPNPAQAFSPLKVYDAQGRPWRAAVEDWEGARRRVTQDPSWAAWLKQERAEVDDWASHHQDRVAWAAGWSHDFVSPKDGSYLVWTDQIPGEQVPFLHSPSDPQVAVTPKIMASWVAKFRGHHADMIRRAARLYRLTGEKSYAQWATAQLDFYADHLTEWVPRKGVRLYWQSLTEAEHIPVYAEVVRLLGDSVSPEHREQWRTRFFQPEVEVVNASFQSVHNIAVWQRVAAADVGLLFNDRAMWREAIYGPFGLNQQLAQGITSDYIWWEQSLGYNNFVVEAVLPLFVDAGLTGRSGELAEDMATAENIMLAPTFMRFPDGRLPNPADETGLSSAPNRGLFAAAYRVFPTGIGLAAAAGSHTWETLLDPPPPAPPNASRLPAVVSWNMESSQMAILRSGPWQVFFHYGQLAFQHAQAEALNFTAYYGNLDVTHDAGTVGYGSPLHANYYTQGLAQNELLVDGRGEEPLPERGKLLHFSAAEGRVSAVQPHYRPDAEASRALAIVDGQLVDTATITSRSRTSRRLGLALHVQGQFRPTDRFVRDSHFAEGRPPAFGYWQNVTVATFHDRADLDIDYHGTMLHVRLAVPGEFKLWHGISPDSPPHRRDSFYAEVLGTSATFITTFTPEIPPSFDSR